MGNRVNDIRRVILALCFFGLILSLIGSELPWVKISQSKAQNPLYIVNKASCNATKYNNTLPTVTELKFTVDVYMTLSSSQLCQNYVSGKLPSYIGGAVLNDIKMCTSIAFKELSNFMQEVDAWNTYSAKCSSSGGAAFFFIIFALIVMSATMLINTFPNIVAKCCMDENSFKNKIIRSLFAFIAPCCVTIGLIIYSSTCVHGDLSNVLSARNMSKTGARGYYICCMSCAMLWVYWSLFLYRMCDNDLVKVQGSNDMKAKFLKKKNDRNMSEDVDAGMIEESQEQRETNVGGSMGAYNENSVFRQENEEEDNGSYDNRKQSISAYDDDYGIKGHAPSAGTWQDVEED